MASQSPWVSRWRVPASYPVAAGYLYFASPELRSLVLGAVVAALGLLLRAAAAGFLCKHERLATQGPYAFTRNPLYLGSTLIALGFCLAGTSWWGAALVAAYLLLFYPPVMRLEGQELRGRYGPVYDDYARRVPVFLPRYSAHAKQAATAGAEFSREQYLRNREYQAGWGVLAGLGLLVVKLLWIRYTLMR
jgi:protein-S-isoprenylcysteine O-methyltransferase Ste14